MEISASKKLNTVQLAHTNKHMSASNFSCDPFKMTPGKQQSNMTGVSIFADLNLIILLCYFVGESLYVQTKQLSEDAKSTKKKT